MFPDTTSQAQLAIYFADLALALPFGAAFGFLAGGFSEASSSGTALRLSDLR